jgi:methyl coenzyme M reductase beta subunit
MQFGVNWIEAQDIFNVVRNRFRPIASGLTAAGIVKHHAAFKTSNLSSPLAVFGQDVVDEPLVSTGFCWGDMPGVPGGHGFHSHLRLSWTRLLIY